MTAQMTMYEALIKADEMGLPDARHEFIQTNSQYWLGEKPPTCAIGGAAVASGVEIQWNKYEPGEVDNWWDFKAPNVADLNSAKEEVFDVGCPCRCDDFDDEMWSPYEMIIHLYDTHLWSRTHIAEWMRAQALL